MTFPERFNATPPARPYAGRRIALATRHGKAQALDPMVRHQLGATLVVASSVDTDALGTFTGEIERTGTMSEVAIAKARLGMAAANLPIGIASEGSFGPHPRLPFAMAGLELIVFVDDERQITLLESIVDDEPCFHHWLARPGEDQTGHLARVDFPRHALIVRPQTPTEPAAGLAKGLRALPDLVAAIETAARLSADGAALVQTDMRAHMNPTRMATIARLATRLGERLNTPCPDCATPGFGLVGSETGLPCSDCGTPTVLARGSIRGCAACDHREFHPRTDGLTEADPRYCPACDP
jgi:hypothetical protein